MFDLILGLGFGIILRSNFLESENDTWRYILATQTYCCLVEEKASDIAVCILRLRIVPSQGVFNLYFMGASEKRILPCRF